MKFRLLTAIGCFLYLGGVASAHRLDEYLQATLISVEKDHIQASMRLIPGVAVSSAVIATIDSNGDGVISTTEQQGYAERVLSDLSLTIDGKRLKPRIVSIHFPQVEEMRQGFGEINIEFTTDLPPGGPSRRLILENHHRENRTVYLVNCLAPHDRAIRIETQNRNEDQSFYQLDYVQSSSFSDSSPSGWSAGLYLWTGQTGVGTLFRLGMRHIADGTDHLLFLLALLLPAPLVASRSRWVGVASVRSSLVRTLRIVTAFTIGHSITLALAALSLVYLPSRPIEVLIAVSILVSAVHALRPLFPGKEAGIAGFFGLIHGLAFAATLTQLGLSSWERVFGILAFNLGIETMQLVVVAVTLPSLILMSRTSAYSLLRIGGALFAAITSVGWIAERLLGVNISVDVAVNSVAHHAVWLAGTLFLISLSCWCLRNVFNWQVSTAASPTKLARQ